MGAGMVDAPGYEELADLVHVLAPLFHRAHRLPD